MDFQQRKLTKMEWESIEVPVSPEEVEILQLIHSGYANVNIKYNKANSLFTFLKIEYTEQLEDYLYNKYLMTLVNDLANKYGMESIKSSTNTSVTIKKADAIRIQKNTVDSLRENNIYEYLLLDHMESALKYKKKKDTKWEFHYFTLYKLSKNAVEKLNRHLMQSVQSFLRELEDVVSISNIIENSVAYIEKNSSLLKHADMMLYDHQKEIFTLCKQGGPKLVLYIAPTGTGKTMSPIGLSQGKRVIFVCAARHVGLALAKAAISVHKKVAFAFGCGCADDIRLHYFSAKEFTTNRKTGGIWKVDNTIGDKVEIMICDIKSYLPAMYYMLSFNPAEEIITYWDEPTITLDYPSHEFHEIIQKNWTENLIPNMVLSSATLPKVHELPGTTSDFITRFPGAKIHSIVSHDCKKSIPILNKDGYVALPHTISENYDEVLKVVEHCENYLTLLRYFDLAEVVQLIMYVNKNNNLATHSKINRHFTCLDDVTMTNIKLYYLCVLKNIYAGTWGSVHLNMRHFRKRKIETNDTVDLTGNPIRKVASVGPGIKPNASFSTLSRLDSSHYENSDTVSSKPIVRTVSEQVIKPPTHNANHGQTGSFAIYVTTKDAYTLTDGPTIFLANDVEKIAKFCIHQANIPAKIMEDILEKIEFNNRIQEKILKLEHELEDKIQKQMDATGATKKDNQKKLARVEDNADATKVKKELDTLYSLVRIATLNETFVPNKSAHLKKWAESLDTNNAFTSNIDERTIHRIMLLDGVENSWKVLLLMGIGVFSTAVNNVEYMEVMKELAGQQKLYMIIASSDYIYGTNYQFCHGYLSKDMELTQEKIIQAMGRIGRSNVQQEYTVRFRDDAQILKLFTADADKPEISNMNKLFNSAR